MPLSMNRFAHIEAKLCNANSTNLGSFIEVIPRINHRYLEAHLLLPKHRRKLESQLRERLRKNLSLGKLDIALSLHTASNDNSALGVNSALLAQPSYAIEQIQEQLTNTAIINTLDILKWPGVVQKQDLDFNLVLAQSLQQFNTVIEQSLENQGHERQEQAKLIEQRLVAIYIQVTNIRATMAKIIQAQSDELTPKVAALQVELERDRLGQELVLRAQKSDGNAEFNRLDIYIMEVRRTVKQSGTIGRRLDVLKQQFNRDANTLPFIFNVSETTLAALKLNALIKKMRKQLESIK